jgi:hypothetical protein
VLFLLVGLAPGEGRASCAAPEAHLSRRVASPGDTVLLTGQYWTADCNDTISCSEGACGRSSCTKLEPARPANDLRVELMPNVGGASRTVATGIDADDALEIRAMVTIPADLLPGTYVVRVLNNEVDEQLSTLRIVVRGGF